MHNVRQVPLTSEDVEPFVTLSVARLYFEQKLYVGLKKEGVRGLKSPRIEDGNLVFRLGPLVRYVHRLTLDITDPGESLVDPDDQVIQNSRLEELQRFSKENPQKFVLATPFKETLSIPLNNGCVVVFSKREHDIRDVMQMIAADPLQKVS